MVQAAHSGRQNIAEGSRAGATSSKSELFLFNVARGSLDELILDFEDYLRHRDLRMWDKESPEALEVRNLSRIHLSNNSNKPISSDLYTPWLNHKHPEIVANALICLIHQANYLLDNQLKGLETQFTAEGGFSERMADARRENKQNRSDRSDNVMGGNRQNLSGMWTPNDIT